MNALPKFTLRERLFIYIIGLCILGMTLLYMSFDNTPPEVLSDLQKREKVSETSKIESFESEIQINSRGVLNVKEDIALSLQPGSPIQHGIKQPIPNIAGPDINPLLGGPISFSKLTMSNESDGYQILKPNTENHPGAYLIYIGDPDKTLFPGVHKFRLNFIADGAFVPQDDSDELHWIAAPFSQMPVLQNKVTLIFPLSVPVNEIQISPYIELIETESFAPKMIGDNTVPIERRKRDMKGCTYQIFPEAHQAILMTTRPLEIGEMFSFDLTVPRGYLGVLRPTLTPTATPTATAN